MKDKKKDYEVTLEVLEERIENDTLAFKLTLFITFILYAGALSFSIFSMMKSWMLGIGVAFTVICLISFMSVLAIDSQKQSRELLYYLKSKEK